MWRDFNRKLSGLFSRKGARRPEQPEPPGSGGEPPFQPNARVRASVPAWSAASCPGLGLGSGIFIVQEGHQAVVTSFGKQLQQHSRRRHPVAAAYPFQVANGGGHADALHGHRRPPTVVQATGLRDSAMLTQDENIVDIQLAAVQSPAERTRAPSSSKQPLADRGRGARPSETGRARGRRASMRGDAPGAGYEQRDARSRHGRGMTSLQAQRRPP
jgi:membrane protease subunit HflK